LDAFQALTLKIVRFYRVMERFAIVAKQDIS